MKPRFASLAVLLFVAMPLVEHNHPLRSHAGERRQVSLADRRLQECDPARTRRAAQTLAEYLAKISDAKFDVITGDGANRHYDRRRQGLSRR